MPYRNPGSVPAQLAWPMTLPLPIQPQSTLQDEIRHYDKRHDLYSPVRVVRRQVDDDDDQIDDDENNCDDAERQVLDHVTQTQPEVPERKPTIQWYFGALCFISWTICHNKRLGEGGAPSVSWVQI